MSWCLSPALLRAALGNGLQKAFLTPRALRREEESRALGTRKRSVVREMRVRGLQTRTLLTFASGSSKL